MPAIGLEGRRAPLLAGPVEQAGPFRGHDKKGEIMAKSLLLLAALLLLTACQNGESLAEAHGPWRQLNVGYWTPTPADLNPQVPHE
jgi:hypothetical protein